MEGAEEDVVEGPKSIPPRVIINRKESLRYRVNGGDLYPIIEIKKRIYDTIKDYYTY